MKRLPVALSRESFRDTWKQSRDSRKATSGSPGIDRISAEQFSSSLDSNIEKIRRAIRTGAFGFSKLRFAPITKDDGGYRIICVPTVGDRLLQRAILRHLESDPRFNASSPISFGFTKNKTLIEAQRAALTLRDKHPWVLKADIIKFFDRIPRAQLKTMIRRKVRAKSIASLLCAAVDCELEAVGGRAAEVIKQGGIVEGIGLRQGMPVSPMLSNLLLKDFDNMLSKNNHKAIRYADDIAIFGDSKEELVGALEAIKIDLKKLALSIPELDDGGKTIIRGPSEVIEFLGVDIKRYGDIYKLTFPARKIEKIEKEMALIATIDDCAKQRRSIGNVVRLLDAFIIGHRGAMSVLGDEAAPFFDRIEAAKRKSLERLIREIIGDRAAEALDDVRRAVLGIREFPTA